MIQALGGWYMAAFITPGPPEPRFPMGQRLCSAVSFAIMAALDARWPSIAQGFVGVRTSRRCLPLAGDRGAQSYCQAWVDPYTLGVAVAHVQSAVMHDHL